MGSETVLGYPCTKLRVTGGTLPNGQVLTGIVWMTENLDLPVRLETNGMVLEIRNLKVGPQPAYLFEIPAGYTRTGTRVTTTATGSAWTLNTNYPGGDFRSIDMATSDPTPCKAACDKDARCKAWTWVKAELEGPSGHCWLKNRIPEASHDTCCVSGVRR